MDRKRIFGPEKTVAPIRFVSTTTTTTTNNKNKNNNDHHDAGAGAADVRIRKDNRFPEQPRKTGE